MSDTRQQADLIIDKCQIGFETRVENHLDVGMLSIETGAVKAVQDGLPASIIAHQTILLKICITYQKSCQGFSGTLVNLET